MLSGIADPIMRCHRCGGYFCDEHRLPEAHLCLGGGFWSETERREMLRQHAAFMDSRMRGTANGAAGVEADAAQERRERAWRAVKGVVVLALFAGVVLVAFSAFHAGLGLRAWTPAGTPTELVHSTPDIAIVNPGLSAANLPEENLTPYFGTLSIRRSFAFHDSLGWRERRIELVLYGGIRGVPRGAGPEGGSRFSELHHRLR